MNDQSFVYDFLVDGLKLQAASSAVQRQLVPDFVHLPDELLNAVHVGSFPQLFREGILSDSASLAIQRYEAFLDTYVASNDYESAVAEVESGNWFEALRAHARDVLLALGEDCSEPSLDHVVYVRGA